MNRYPSWLNILVLVIFMLGIVLALPNIYSSVPSVQIANSNGIDFDDDQLQEVVDAMDNIRLSPLASFIEEDNSSIAVSCP